MFLPQGTRPHRTRARVRVLLRAFHAQYPHIKYDINYSDQGTRLRFLNELHLTEFALRWSYRSLVWQRCDAQGAAQFF